jgi:CDP-diacylglycerol--glycerol-3-phosphate 3-phosphatidyltransferase
MIPNILSLSRALLIFGLFNNSTLLRASCIAMAALTDFLDGYIARKYSLTSKLGTILDPITDKLFVGAALMLFFHEEKLTLFEITLFLLRDISLLLFTLWLWFTKSLKSWQIRSFLCGKLMTTCQFILLLLLALNQPIHSLFFWALFLFGTGSFFELVYINRAEVRKTF